MSSVEQLTYPGVLRDHAERLREMERSGSPRIYVGTVGVDGVDDLLTPDSPPFENGVTNFDPVNQPVAFWRLNGHIYLDGQWTVPDDNTTLFHLPIGYRPPRPVGPFTISDSTGAHVATYKIATDGSVVFVQQVV